MIAMTLCRENNISNFTYDDYTPCVFLQNITTASRSVMTCVWWANTQSRTTSRRRRFASLNAVCCGSAQVCLTPALDTQRGNPASSSRWTGSVAALTVLQNSCNTLIKFLKRHRNIPEILLQQPCKTPKTLVQYSWSTIAALLKYHRILGELLLL